MRAGLYLIGWVDGRVKPMVCLLPFKANTAKQSHGAGRKGEGRANRRPRPRPLLVSQAAKDQTQRRRRATTPTVLWLALMGLNLQQKKWWRDYRLLFSLFLCWSEGKVGVVIGKGWWGETKKNYRGQEGVSNIKKITKQSDWLEERRVNFHI